MIAGNEMVVRNRAIEARLYYNYPYGTSYRLITTAHTITKI